MAAGSGLALRTGSIAPGARGVRPRPARGVASSPLLALDTTCEAVECPRMGAEDQIRKLIADVTEADPSGLDLHVYGLANPEGQAALSDTRFLDSLGRLTPALAQGLIILAQHIDAINASSERRDDVTPPE
jgi:hypothetical protein